MDPEQFQMLIAKIDGAVAAIIIMQIICLAVSMWTLGDRK